MFVDGGVRLIPLLLLNLLILWSADAATTETRVNESATNASEEDHVVKKDDAKPVLIVISYDAFRPEYFDRNVTPFMNNARKTGSSVAYLSNEFPTKTFVNHHSIATGLYPAVHGVLANSLYDLKLKKKLDYSYELFHYNPDVIPIWTLNEKSDGHSGCMMWPGSDLAYDGNVTCTYTQKYNSTIPWKWRVDTAISWIKAPENPANLIMMYFEEPDKHAHAFSPDSKEITEIVKQLDELSQYIQEKIIAEKLDNRVNVIHLSDHGMASVQSPNFIDLRKWLENGTYQIYGSSPVLQVVPADGKEDEIFSKLSNASQENGHFKVYDYESMPKRWYCENHQRLGPIVAVADINYAFQDMFDAAEYYKKEYNISISPSQKYGVHGYDNADPLMHAIFFANGPQFKKNNQVAPFSSIDLFNLFCLILDINTIPNNGTMNTIVDLLVMEPNVNPHSMTTSKILIVGIPLLVVIIACLTGLIVFTIKYKRRRKSFNVEKGTATAVNGTSMEGEKLLQNHCFNDSDDT